MASRKVFTKLNATASLKYDGYVIDDLEKCGMENVCNLVTVRALLREIIKERYMFGFRGMLEFDDLRRLGCRVRYSCASFLQLKNDQIISAEVYNGRITTKFKPKCSKRYEDFCSNRS